MYLWLKHRVNVIFHKPLWEHKLSPLRTLMSNMKDTSSNYESMDKLISTLIRFDVPLLFSKEKYVLYTDTDVVFMKDVHLHEFHPLPRYYTVGAEFQPHLTHSHANNAPMYAPVILRTNISKRMRIKYGNAGIILYNVNSMLSTYQKFVDWVFQPIHLQRGLHFGKFGPLDQGAYNSFYMNQFRVVKYPFFNWKPYWGYNKDATIIHFHGPKLEDYVSYRKRSNVSHSFKKYLRKCNDDCYDYVEWTIRIQDGV